MRTVPLTDAELRAYSKEHLRYEVVMLRQVWRLPATGVAKNAKIESFVVHLRNLIDFLYPTHPKPDDVIAADFFKDAKAWAFG